MKHLTQLTKLALLSLAAAIVFACGSNATSSPTEAPNTPQPTATFQSIQVTVPPKNPPTPTPIPEGTPSTKGGTKFFPEALKSEEGLTVGPLMTTWQDYLNDSVMVFDGNTLDLCGRGNGVAIGKFMNGGIVWTLGLPREGMEPNEVFFTLWNPENDVGGAFVLGYENDTPLLRIVTNYKYSDPITPFTYREETLPFETYELTNCLNL